MTDFPSPPQRTRPSSTVKSTIVITLGSISAIIGLWFWMKENNYIQSDRACLYGDQMCLAEVLQIVSVGQILTGIAVILVGTWMRERN